MVRALYALHFTSLFFHRVFRVSAHSISLKLSLTSLGAALANMTSVALAYLPASLVRPCWLVCAGIHCRKQTSMHVCCAQLVLSRVCRRTC